MIDQLLVQLRSRARITGPTLLDLETLLTDIQTELANPSFYAVDNPKRTQRYLELKRSVIIQIANIQQRKLLL